MQRQDVSPFVVHATHQNGGWEAKRHRLREAGLWNDGQDYYETGRYIEMQVREVQQPKHMDAVRVTIA